MRSYRGCSRTNSGIANLRRVMSIQKSRRKGSSRPLTTVSDGQKESLLQLIDDLVLTEQLTLLEDMRTKCLGQLANQKFWDLMTKRHQIKTKILDRLLSFGGAASNPSSLTPPSKSSVTLSGKEPGKSKKK